MLLRLKEAFKNCASAEKGVQLIGGVAGKEPEAKNPVLHAASCCLPVTSTDSTRRDFDAGPAVQSASRFVCRNLHLGTNS